MQTQHLRLQFCAATIIFQCRILLDEYLKKLFFLLQITIVTKIPHPLNSKVLKLICNIFQIYLFCYVHQMQGFNYSTKYSCQLYLILATETPNLGRLNRRLLKVIDSPCIKQTVYK